MGIAISTASEGLREAARHFGGAALCRLRLPLPPASDRHPRRGFITRSSLPVHAPTPYQDAATERCVPAASSQLPFDDLSSAIESAAPPLEILCNSSS